MTPRPNVLFAGGGSLGCVYPALTIASRLAARAPGMRATIAGDGRAIERHTARGAGLGYTHVPGDDTLQRISTAPLRWLRRSAGWAAAHWLLRELDINLVVSLGGSTSGPVCAAARQSGVPMVLVEADCLPAAATVRHAAAAKAVCLAFEETRARLPLATGAIVTGGVGRPGFERFAAPSIAPPVTGGDSAPTLIVLGGAAGASSLNHSAPDALRRLGPALEGWRVVHQTGAGALADTEARYRSAGVDAVVVTYIDELADLAASASLAVCRPAGSTLAELALAGLPAVLAPDTRRRDDVHGANARAAAIEYRCPSVDERGDFAAALARSLGTLLTDAAARQAIADRMRRRARPDAADLVAGACCEALGIEPAPAALAPRRRRAA
ncbi:UDP-N-acetylglucosamine--N-acetylmuramyl-(pentapeptide) pyrophosphoryl-undecaprenol N-acetylglucosamine transferase [Botrimarina sp.]|uniref:UDP-N-acetylglucosamine--N-acetylmuramyl- (pentapeptide) pyrophosphoryl-undecaprenol N-acetylglucosamine transferase n=1 Tax=Botrimarina sp. TaxID=2795802 RepID=UPI0032EB2111